MKIESCAALEGSSGAEGTHLGVGLLGAAGGTRCYSAAYFPFSDYFHSPTQIGKSFAEGFLGMTVTKVFLYSHVSLNCTTFSLSTINNFAAKEISINRTGSY